MSYGLSSGLKKRALQTLMQKPFHLPSPKWVFILALASLWICLFISQGRSDPYASGGIDNAGSKVQPIAAGGLRRGFYRTGVQILLAPGALTYWRVPGEAGVPPVFSFAGSENVARAEVLYPAPERIEEDGTQAFGYRGEVIFPIHVTPEDAARPVLLMLSLSYAVCKRICMPESAEMQIRLAPSDGPGPQEAVLAKAEAKLPRPLSGEEANGKFALTRVPSQAAVLWRLTWLGSPATDLFVEAPEGWYFETKKTGQPNEFLIEQVQAKEGAALPPLTLTLTGPQVSFEFPLSLDSNSAKP